MTSIIPRDQVVWGLQLPIQSGSTAFVQPWEATAGASELARIAQAADVAGAFYVGVCDHVAVPERAVAAMSATWYDTIATLSWLAAQTTHVHLLSHVYVAPYRHPLVTAKAFSTLDHLSDGRVLLGLGAGHLREEFELLGVPFEQRGRLLDEAIGALRDAFEDEFVPVDLEEGQVSFGARPRPARPGGPPIWVGGSTPAAIRRAALRADGWLPQGPPEGGMRATVAHIREMRASMGLPDAFDMGINLGAVFLGAPTFDVPEHSLIGGAEQIVERLRAAVAIGCNQLQVRFLGRDAHEYAEQVERFGAEVWPLLD